MAIKPDFKRERAGRSAAFIGRTLILSTGRMGFLAVRRAKHNVDKAAVSFPTRDTRSKVRIGICDSGRIFFAVFIFRSVRIWVATSPELFDKSLALFIGLQGLKSLSLFIRDDPAHVLIHPALIDLFIAFRLFLFRLLLFLLVLIAIVLCESRQNTDADYKDQAPNTKL